MGNCYSNSHELDNHTSKHASARTEEQMRALALKVEICAPGIISATHAQLAGADRIELCQSLEVGGLTPSAGSIAFCLEKLGIRTHVLIRPRPGNFCYSPEEIDVIFRDIKYCKSLGASAAVIGFLRHDGTVDQDLTAKAVEMAYPMEVTFHRAFDECTDWPSQLETIIHCGCHRLLTSGHCESAYLGKENLGLIQRLAAGRIKILAGCGITPENVGAIISESGVDEVHGSCKAIQPNGLPETDLSIAQSFVSEARKSFSLYSNAK